MKFTENIPGSSFSCFHLCCKKTKQKYPFDIKAIVVLPDHLHTIWKLPAQDHDFSKRWRLIKQIFSKSIQGETNHRGEKNIWQKRFWEHLIRDEQDYKQHMNYIFYNPVKHGYVDKAIDWPYSSFLQAIKEGLYDQEWGFKEPDNIRGMMFE